MPSSFQSEAVGWFWGALACSRPAKAKATVKVAFFCLDEAEGERRGREQERERDQWSG
jgi:hypothetical protein